MSTTVAPGKKRFKLSPTVVIVGVVVIVAGVGGWFIFKPKAEVDPYHATPVTTGTIVKTVSASGTLQALVTVDVGSQVNGQVKDVMVDFDSHVRKGQVLAKLDPETFQTRLDSSNADALASQQAIRTAEANLAQTVANAKVTEQNFNRTKALAQKGYVAEQALQEAQAQLDSAKASIQVQQSQIAAAEARAKQSDASVHTSRIDVDRTTITSPIDGVVVDRKVDPGQTVVSSMSAQTMFKIAQDLSKLQLKILVDEADIGSVREGQTVSFTVDAFPDSRFRGLITQVRKQPQTQNNVVAYEVIAESDNPDGKLLPGMTANASITLERHPNVMRVPNAALRWQPVDLTAQRTAAAGAWRWSRRPRAALAAAAASAAASAAAAAVLAAAAAARRAGGRRPRWRRRPDERLRPDQARRRSRWTSSTRSTPTSARPCRTVRPRPRRTRAAACRWTARRCSRPGAQDQRGRPQEDRRAAHARQQKAQVEQIRNGGGDGLQRGQIYVIRDGTPHRVGVGLGATDGQTTEVVSPNIKVGDLAVTTGGPKAKKSAAAGAPGGAPGAPGGAGGGRRG